MNKIKKLIDIPSFEPDFLESIISHIRNIENLKKDKNYHYLIDFNQIVFFGHILNIKEGNSRFWIKNKDLFSLPPQHKPLIVNSYITLFHPLIKTDNLVVESMLDLDSVAEIFLTQSSYLGFWIDEPIINNLNYIFTTKGHSLKFHSEKITPELVKKLEKNLSREVIKVFEKYFISKNLNDLLPLLKSSYSHIRKEIIL